MKIEQNVPIPPTIKDILKEMKIGESIVLNRKIQTQLSINALYANIKVKSKKIDDDSIRVWRIV